MCGSGTTRTAKTTQVQYVSPGPVKPKRNMHALLLSATHTVNAEKILFHLSICRANITCYSHEMGKSPMHIAAMKGDIEKLWILYDEGFDLNTKDEAGNTFYHTAARENKVNVLQEFAKEVSIDLQNDNGKYSDSPS